MKKFVLIALMLIVCAMSANAATIYGKVSNLAPYDKGAIVCGIDASYADSFASLLSTLSPTDGTRPGDALAILKFIQDHNQSNCWNTQPDGGFGIKLSDERHFVVIICMSTDSHVYWYVENVNASIEQVITTTAPSF